MIHDDIELLIAWRADRRVNEWYGGFEQATPEAIQADWDDEAWCERAIIEVDGRPVGSERVKDFETTRFLMSV
jgi:hypothetical protein